MSSTNPCAIYNFYNCCDPNGTTFAPFIWQSGNILDPNIQPGSGAQEILAPSFAMTSGPDADLKNYQGLMPLHRKARLTEISLIKFPPMLSGPAYTASVMFNLVVLDYNGVVIRTLSTASINFQTVPVRTWTPISISSVSADLEVLPGQLIAGELVFGAALLPGQSVAMLYQLSGTGMLM